MTEEDFSQHNLRGLKKKGFEQFVKKKLEEEKAFFQKELEARNTSFLELISAFNKFVPENIETLSSHISALEAKLEEKNND